MNAHLNDEQLTTWLLGEGDPLTTQHLLGCAECRAEVAQLRDAVSGWREALISTAEHEEVFWAQQRRLTQERIATQRRVPFLRWAATVAMALVIVAALFLPHAPHAVTPAKDEAGDEALLQQVDHDLQRDYPQALAPAVLIDQERNAALSANAGTTFGDSRNRSNHNE